MTHPLDSFFNPKTIAVIGASNNTIKIGHATLKNILISDYICKLYPVNPHDKQILGLKSYKKVTGIPTSIDLALIAVLAKFVPEIIADCVKKKIKNVIIHIMHWLHICLDM